ncbi:glycine receptor subunit alpha-3 [Eurytemora carolleeae]|uniref:glycine receptor subunit alpha-3 n=1 Tax=Eurytemora carolleeae TaxID=1294199 RepID=UPI000C7869B0|nr:glycine receptor subunit alpha-3 [Eurytemora carolleeae]|eukprot:XP_023347755.1 glycine receptor subunit alpha-3-like [Eurytemora affinis]
MLPNETLTEVNIGIDIKDIPNVNDHDFSVTLNGFFLVRWTDTRLILHDVKFGNDGDELIPVDVSMIDKIWVPDIEILNLKEFETLAVLKKLEGLWLNRKLELVYAVACRITWICPMSFDNFPLDVQVCKFQVGSFNYDNTNIVFKDEFVADAEAIRSVLDYSILINELSEEDKHSVVLTGNFSVTGFELVLKRKMSHYIITYYFPAGMFVIVSWISFLVPPESVPGRMTILVTVFLVLVNIFNSITNNIPKAEGLTAIEGFIIVCIVFVFGALIEYAVILFQSKIKTCTPPNFRKKKNFKSVTDVKNAFQKIDVNGDGKLSKREMLAGDEFTQEEIETIFELGDVDGDGEIELGEFIGLMCPPEKGGNEAAQMKIIEQNMTAKYKRRVQRLNSWFEGIDLNVKSNESDLEKIRTARLDLFFLGLFPILFFIFNFFYWIVFLTRAQYIL